MLNFEKIIEDIDRNSKSIPKGHTEYQIKNFIIGNQPSLYGKYRQCITELNIRSKTYKNLVKKLAKESNCDLEKEEIKEAIEDTQRETYIIYNIFLQIKEQIKDRDIQELEKEHWDLKFFQELKAYIMTGQNIPVGLIQNILSLDKESKTRQNLLSMLKYENKKDKYETLDANITRNITDQ